MLNTFALNQFQFYAFGIYFLLIIILLFIFPAIILLQKLKIKKAWQELTLAFILSTSLWTVQAFIFAWINCRWLTYFYLLALIIYNLINYKIILKWSSKFFREIKSIKPYFILIILLGILLQLIPISTSGLKNNDHTQINYYFTNSVDAIMHLSFISSMTHQFPPIRPEIYAEPLTSYHYLTDLFQADLVRVFYLSINHLFFQYLPPLISLFTALSLAMIIRFFTKQRAPVVIALLLLFFTADLGFIISYLIHHQFNFNYAVIDNGLEQFLNFPQTMAKMNFYLSIFLLLNYWHLSKQKSALAKKYAFALIPIASIIVGYKIYYGIFILLGLGLVTFSEFLISLFNSLKAKQKEYLFNWLKTSCTLGLAVAIPAILVFLSNNQAGGSGLIWVPFAWGELLLSATHLDDINYFLTKQWFEATHSLKGQIKNSLWLIIVTFTSIFGIRITGLWPITPKKFPHTPWQWYLLFYPPVCIFIFLGLNTLQSPGGFNTFNFFIVSINILIIPLALNLGWWWSKYTLYKFVIPLLFVISLPRIINSSQYYLTRVAEEKADFILSTAEENLLSLASIKLPPSSIIQAHPANQTSYQSNAYLDFFTGHPTYLASQLILESHGQSSYLERAVKIKYAFDQQDASLTLNSLRNLGITHLYLKLNEEKQANLFQDIPSEKIILQNEVAAFITTD